MERLIAVVAKTKREAEHYIYQDLEESPPVKWRWCISVNELRGIDPDSIEVHILPSAKEVISYYDIKNFCAMKGIEIKYPK